MLLTGKTQAMLNAEKAEVDRLAEIASFTEYLSSTDWYVSRMAETGKVIPIDIAKTRAVARERISELRSKE